MKIDIEGKAHLFGRFRIIAETQFEENFMLEMRKRPEGVTISFTNSDQDEMFFIQSKGKLNKD